MEADFEKKLEQILLKKARQVSRFISQAVADGVPVIILVNCELHEKQAWIYFAQLGLLTTNMVYVCPNLHQYKRRKGLKILFDNTCMC
jgi:hypothetical protein